MLTISNVSIAAIASTVPATKVSNLSLGKIYGKDEISKLIKSTGVETRHIATCQQTTADLCFNSAVRILDSLGWSNETVGGLIFVSQTPDYQLPATACVLQERLGLSKSTISFDINMGCSGYVYGLYLASTLISSGVERVLLLVGDTISKIVKNGDRSTELLFGDAGTATALQYKSDSRLDFKLGTDGSGFEYIIAKDKTIGNIAERGMSSAFLTMNGGEVFKFTLSTVPEIINEFMTEKHLKISDIDACVYHQANRFMLKHLAKKTGFAEHQVPLSIVEYGNTSSASIPLTICSEEIVKRSKVLMAGFGVGLSWGVACADLSETLLLGVSEV